MQYRAEIDGLRAIAVLAVLFYHIGFEFVSGGFVGVDVFFVISGYLISANLYRASVHKDKISSLLKDFYERRARRIIPAYLFVSLIALIASYLLFMPDRFSEFGSSLIFSSLFSANLYFWMNGNYFGPAAETQPLLHYWSLGVEEHFYIIFPVFAIFLLRFSLKLFAASAAFLFFISLFLSQALLPISPTTVFYMLPFRAWELLAGSLLALPFVPKPKGQYFGGAAVVTGLALIGFSAVQYSEATAFPGVAALPPVVGAALIIWGGQTSSFVTRCLSVSPLVYVGRISYSLYLVHWPVIVFTRHAIPGVEFWSGTALVISVSLALAMVSYHCVESPTRRRDGFWTTSFIAKFSFLGTSALLVLALIIFGSAGFPQRLPPDVREMLAYKYDYSRAYREGSCFLRPEQTYREIDMDACVPAKKGPVVLLWGDSYAAHYVPGLQLLFEKEGYGFGQLTASACPPIAGHSVPSRPNCKPFNDYVLSWITEHKPDVVILSAAWIVDDALPIQLYTTVASIAKAGSKVIFLGQSPIYRDVVPTLIAEHWMVGNRSKFSSAEEVSSDVFRIDKNMMSLFEKTELTYISVIDRVCINRRCEFVSEAKKPYHWDRGHLTTEGSTEYVARISDRLMEVLASREHSGMEGNRQ